MNHRDQEKLLKEILPSEDMGDFRQISLERGLAGLRREQRRRHVMRYGLAVGVVVLTLGILFGSRNQSRPDRTAGKVPAPAAPAALAASHIDIINDDQLLAIFTNQPVALIGKPGAQRLVFLEKAEDKSGPF